MDWESLNTFLGFTNSFVQNDLPSPNVVIWVLTLILILRFLHVLSSSEVPKITFREKSEKSFINELIGGITMLQEPYRPPPLWGRSGHVQTAAYGLLGHSSLKRTFDRRICLKMSDGTTAYVDIFEPINPHPDERDVTLTLVPGIANTSESNYIRTCVHLAQEHGFVKLLNELRYVLLEFSYRCAVLNHLGALQDVKLTGNRIFSYGGTDEAVAMMNYLFGEYPETKFVNIGFSMGGNITTLLLLRLAPELRNRIIMGLSVGQGYSATVSAPMYHDWENGRRAYNYIITENMKRLLRRNYDKAVLPHVQSGLIDEQRLWSATSIIAFDEHYNRKVFGYSSLDAFYEQASCLPHLADLRIPMIFLNAEDDPIVPRSLWEPVKKLATEKDGMAFISTRHGGHLGFLEGGSFTPKSITWLDRFIVEMTNQAVKLTH